MAERLSEYSVREEKQIRDRLARIEGQVRGIGRMVEDRKYCVDILMQVAAARAALDRVGLLLLENHTRGCVQDAVQHQEGEAAIDELMDVLTRFIR